MKAVILAAGPGTRLMPLTKTIPKVMVPIGADPLLGHLLHLCATHRVTDVYLNLWYLPQPVIDYVSSHDFGIQVHWKVFEKLVSATDALLAFETDLADGDFFILFGDVASKLNLTHLSEFHKRKKALLTAVLHESSHPDDSDLVLINNDCEAVQFVAKPHPKISSKSAYGNAGTVVCSPEIFTYIKPGTDPDDSISHTLIKPLIDKHAGVFGYVTRDYMKDMGTPERLQKVRKEFVI
jgi:NDP-sugar pyrophosphorylase family protein